MIRRLGLLILMLSFTVPPMAQDTGMKRRRYAEPPPPNPILDASNRAVPDWEHSTREERARQQAQVDLAKQQLRKLHEDTERLVKLAHELKAELDRSAAQKLSLDAVKKTEQIEKLAKNIRSRMKTL